MKRENDAVLPAILPSIPIDRSADGVLSPGSPIPSRNRSLRTSRNRWPAMKNLLGSLSGKRVGCSRPAAEPGGTGHRLLHTHFVYGCASGAIFALRTPSVQRFRPYSFSDRLSRSCDVLSEW